MPDGSSTAHLYRPKLATTFAEGYGLAAFRKDAVAGLTVAVVALPLSMAIAVASGVTPERGLITAIVGGFIVSALGGSRWQIGGPAGAFIVLVSATVTRHGLDGLLVAVFLSGLMIAAIGALRLGRFIRYMPHAVTVGFTGGIAVVIAASQLKDLGGLTLTGAEPGPIVSKLAALAQALPSFTPAALALGTATAASIFLMRWRWPAMPGILIAVIFASATAALLKLPVETIGSHFGGVPSGVSLPRWPDLATAKIIEMLPAALSFTLLGGIESLLSAKVADAMTGRKHRYNMELVAQGVANVASACFGGISVTGTIARTATNIRAGAKSPIAGILHAAFLLVFILVAAPLANYIPLAALAGVLIVVCWSMAEKAEFVRLLKHWQSAAVLLATFLLTVLVDLTVGIAAGCAIAALLAITGCALKSDA